MRDFHSKMRKKPLQIKDKDKLLVTCEQEQTELITKHFGNLVAPNRDVQIKRYPPTSWH